MELTDIRIVLTLSERLMFDAKSILVLTNGGRNHENGEKRGYSNRGDLHHGVSVPAQR